MHNDRYSNVVSLSDWPTIPKHAPVGSPEIVPAIDLEAVVGEALQRLRRDGESQRSERLAHLRNFRSTTFRLIDDLAISIEETEDGFIARSFDTGQYGFGVSADDAISHLCGVLEEYYVILQEDRGRLSEPLESHLLYLDSILRRL